jgi:uncharacterized membrane protein YidH (DUF202 family)
MHNVKHDPFASEMFKNFLADKRTSLSYLRTGIGILTVPMSLLTILIATSSKYQVSDVLGMLLGLGAAFVGLVTFGVWMVISSLRQLRAVDLRLKELEDENPFLSRWVSYDHHKKVASPVAGPNID